MKKLLTTGGLALMLAGAALAQSSNLTLLPGKLAVFKAGDSTGVFNISTARVQPCFVTVYDPSITNQASPLVTVALPTNAPNGIWINDHAGSEGGGISRTMNRQFLVLEGYTGNILSPTAAKPSADPTVSRGFGTMDAFGNEQVIYSDLADWFGLPPGTTQNNPTGIASTDGTNFWGTGNVTGSSSEASGVLFYNANVSSEPEELENYIQAAAQARIVGGTLYVVVPGGGVYNFLDPFNNDAVVPLPYDPNVSNSVQHVVLTNLYLNWGSTFKNIANFDMNPAGTIAYGADQTFGIVKFTNNGSAWTQAPYYFGTTNIGTSKQKTAATQGCFGIAVDFSGTNPVIYATTMENGTSPLNNSQGNANQNRLIKIVDTGVNPGTNLVAITLATAATTNESFRGLDFTPDLRPLVTSTPGNYGATNGGNAYFSVAATSVYALNYLWLQNGVALSAQTSSNLTLTGLTTSYNGYTYQCVVSNAYGAVTSAPAVLTVTLTAQAPTITNAPASVTAYGDGNVTFAQIYPVGTAAFTYQWYEGSTALVDDGMKYSGSTTASLSITNLQTNDTGNYYVVVRNAGGSASNLVDVLTVVYHKATINSGLPVSATTFVGYSTSLAGTESGGMPPLTYQWYKGTTALTDTGDFSGSQTDTLTVNPASLSDAGSFTLVINNPGGSVTSSVATVTVLVPPPLSYVGYSNQTYLQNFDSLPDPGSNSVNSVNNPKDVGTIAGKTYSLANPFDFTYPVITASYIGGLGLSNTMPGWYGAADTLYTGADGISRFGAQDGDQTTGGVIDFGPNDGATITGTNRALGLLTTATTGSTTYALKLVNQSGSSLNYLSLSFLGELWHNGTGARTMSFGYTVDPTATNFTLSAQSISNSTLVPGLAFSFPVAQVVTTVDGTQASNQVSLSTNNLLLSTNWAPSGALWLIWSEEFYGSGGGNGYAIDNFSFKASTSPTGVVTTPVPKNPVYSSANGFSFSFTNTPGAGFTVYGTTNLSAPVVWTSLGAPTETAHGTYSTYSFTDASAVSKVKRFYKVTSP